MDMNKWIEDVLAAEKKKALPVLSFPAVQKMGITVKELIDSSDKQAEAMKIVADSVPENEYTETYNKALAVMNAVKNAGEVYEL